jgi:hypothetical protein
VAHFRAGQSRQSDACVVASLDELDVVPYVQAASLARAATPATRTWSIELALVGEPAVRRLHDAFDLSGVAARPDPDAVAHLWARLHLDLLARLGASRGPRTIERFPFNCLHGWLTISRTRDAGA